MGKKSKNKSTAKTKQTSASPEAVGLIILAFGVTLALSLASFAFRSDTSNWIGLAGYKLGYLFHGLFGLGSYFLAGYVIISGWKLFLNKPSERSFLRSLHFLLLISSFCLLMSLIEEEFPSFARTLNQTFYPGWNGKSSGFHLGGAPYYYLYKDIPGVNFSRIFNTTGTLLLLSALILVSAFCLLGISPGVIAERLQNLISALSEKIKGFKVSFKQDREPSNAAEERFVKVRIPNRELLENNGKNHGSAQELLAIKPETNLKERPSLSKKEIDDSQIMLGNPEKPQKQPKKEPFSIGSFSKENGQEKPAIAKRELALSAQRIVNGDYTSYQLPQPALLTSPKVVDQALLKKDLKRKAEVLEETLHSFGIDAKVGQINCGPTITSFEVHPAIGVKVQRITALESDIALNLEAKSIRIIAPIPGKAAVGIEVPNAQPQEVAFKDLLTAYQEGGKKLHIPILLGKAVNGDYVMSDLAKMPHCIIAGATGSGKSVCINTIVMSIILNAKPDEIKLLMVDPKKVELTPYTNLPHMLAPVITEPRGACAALNWLVKEMESRYELLKLLGLRNIEAFNTRTVDKEKEASLGKEFPEKMPFLVGIIDELADLMMVASSDIETPIARIAQMARAVGIHLILATQRPSREVITGLIKANFPTRISFKVASRVNSQIVLDEIGAESLLGNGDMLFLPPGTSHLIRAQGAFIRDQDINSVIKHVCDQAPTRYVIESFDNYSGSDLGSSSFNDDDETDELFEDALDIILSTGNASTTFLQRKLKVGYARAASLIDQLEARGYVGPAEGAKPRKILAPLKNKEPDDALQLTLEGLDT